MFLSFCFFEGIDKVMRRHVWMEVETCGDCWTVEESVFIFIYIPVISFSLVSKLSTQNRPTYLARYHYSSSHCCPFGAVFALILFRFNLRKVNFIQRI